jgi:DNA-binding CsgD family transcriptional regulator
MILFFSKLGQFSTNAKEVLKKLYGLTEAESRLAVMLLGGLSIEQSAQRLGITLNTARTHLKKLFLKTETNRQGELIRVMLESPATLYLD